MLLFGIKLSNYLSKCALKLRADVARGVNNRVQQPILTRACVTRMLCCVCAMMCGNICSYFCSNSCRCCCWLLVLSSQTAALTLNTSTHNTHTHSLTHTPSLSPSELRVERSLSLSKQRFHWDSLLQLNKYLSTLKMTRCLPRLASSTQLHHLLTWAIDIGIEMSIELQIIKDSAPRIIL